MDEFVNAEWAQDAVNKIDDIIKRLNATTTLLKPIRIVWGYADADDARFQSQLKQFQEQCGLLAWNDEDFQITMGKDAVKSLPDWCDIKLATSHPVAFDLSPRNVFNVLWAAGTTTLVLRGVKLDGKGGLEIHGITLRQPVEVLTPSVLHGSLTELISRRAAVEAHCNGSGYDFWGDLYH